MNLIKILLAFTFVIATTNSFTQEWKKFHSEEGFDFYIKYSECHFNDVQDQSWALIKVENTNSFDAEINFYYEQYLDGKCYGCGVYTEEKKKTVQIPSGATKEGTCKPDSRRGPLDVFHKFTLVKARELTDLKIVQFQFEKIRIK